MNLIAIAKLAAQVIPPAVELIRRIRRGRKGHKMDNYLDIVGDKIKQRLGGIVHFLEPIAEGIQVVKVTPEKKAEIKARNHELREAAQALIAVADKSDEALDDDNVVDGKEAYEQAQAVFKFFDEMEDVITGKDEDD